MATLCLNTGFCPGGGEILWIHQLWEHQKCSAGALRALLLTWRGFCHLGVVPELGKQHLSGCVQGTAPAGDFWVQGEQLRLCQQLSRAPVGVIHGFGSSERQEQLLVAVKVFIAEAIRLWNIQSPR